MVMNNHLRPPNGEKKTSIRIIQTIRQQVVSISLCGRPYCQPNKESSDNHKQPIDRSNDIQDYLTPHWIFWLDFKQC